MFISKRQLEEIKLENYVEGHIDTINAICGAGECQSINKNKDEVTNKEPDMVAHPPHYQSETGMETIDVIEAFTFDLTGIEAVATANALKYLCRWKKKDGKRDLKKAAWYINHLIKHIEKMEKENKNS